MASGEIRVGDVGTVFRATILDQDNTVVDVSSASTINFIFQRPNDSVLTKSGTFVTDGTDGQVQYTTVAGDINLHGKWNYQVYVEFSSASKWYTDISKFTVHPNLETF